MAAEVVTCVVRMLLQHGGSSCIYSDNCYVRTTFHTRKVYYIADEYCLCTLRM